MRRTLKVLIGCTLATVITASSGCASPSRFSTGSIDSTAPGTTITSIGLSVATTDATIGPAHSEQKSSTHPGSSTTVPAPSQSPTVLKPVTMPATLVRSKTGGVAAFVVMVVRAKQFFFEIDTGASNTILDTSIAAELGLTAAGPTVTRNTLGCTATSQPMQVSNWSVGGEALPPGVLITTKTQFAGKKLNGLPFAGLLGADIDAAFGALTVDYTAKTVTLGGQVPSTGKAIPVKILRGKGEVQVRTSAMVHSVPTAMVVDTGASSSEVDSAFAKRAGLKNAGEPQTVNSVSCATMVQPVTLDRMVIGSTAMPTVVGISSTIPSKSPSTAESFGLIGSDILSSYGRIGIDFRADKLVLGS